MKASDGLQVWCVISVWDEPDICSVVSGDPESVAGEYGRHTLYKMLGYFSLVGLLRLHSLLGDYYQAIKVLENIELNKKVRSYLVAVMIPLFAPSVPCSPRSSPLLLSSFRVCTLVCPSARLPPITMLALPTWWWGVTRTPFGSLPTSCSTSRGPGICSRGPRTNTRWWVWPFVLDLFQHEKDVLP